MRAVTQQKHACTAAVGTTTMGWPDILCQVGASTAIIHIKRPYVPAIACACMHACMHIPRLPDVHAVPLDRLACRAAPADAELPDSPSHPNDNTEQQQNQRSEPSQPSSSLSHQDDPQQLLHSESAQQQDPQAAVQQQQQSDRYLPEHQLLKTAMKKLQALEAYQQLLSSSSSGPDEKQLQRKAGDGPAEVSAKIAANKDELPLLDAAILIAQVRISSRWSSQNKGSIVHIKAVHMHVWSAAASREGWPSQAGKPLH